MSRYYAPSSEEQRPLFWFRGYGVYATHLLVVVYVVTMLVTTLLMASRTAHWLDWARYASTAVLRGEVWRLFTYGLPNPPSLGFALEMLMLVWFGREVEKFFGRKTFLGLYAALYLLNPLLFTALGPWLPLQLSGASGAFALFVAFATLYPGAMMLFNILAQWAAIALIGIFSLIHLAARDWTSLLALWTTSGFAFAFVRYQQGHFTLPDLRFWRRKPKLRVLPDLPPEERAARPQTKSATPPGAANVDAILDKIAQSGFNSLTSVEKARLEAARADLLQRKGR